MKQDKYYLSRAIKLAAMALDDGGTPFGAVLVNQGTILAEARNRTVEDRVPLSHAEIVAIRHAYSEHTSQAIQGATLYCTCEPCPMCTSAAYYAQISRIVFAATIWDAIYYGSGDPPVTSKWLNEKCNFNLRVEQGTGRAEVMALFQEFAAKFGTF